MYPLMHFLILYSFSSGQRLHPKLIIQRSKQCNLNAFTAELNIVLEFYQLLYTILVVLKINFVQPEESVAEEFVWAAAFFKDKQNVANVLPQTVQVKEDNIKYRSFI